MFVRPGLIELQGTPPPPTSSRKSGIAKPPSGGLVKPTTRTSIAGADRRKSVKETPKAARSRSSSQNRSKVSSAKPSRDPSPKAASTASPDQKTSPENVTETASKETPLSPVQESKPIVSGGFSNWCLASDWLMFNEHRFDWLTVLSDRHQFENPSQEFSNQLN